MGRIFLKNTLAYVSENQIQLAYYFQSLIFLIIEKNGGSAASRNVDDAHSKKFLLIKIF